MKKLIALGSAAIVGLTLSAASFAATHAQMSALSKCNGNALIPAMVTLKSGKRVQGFFPRSSITSLYKSSKGDKKWSFGNNWSIIG